MDRHMSESKTLTELKYDMSYDFSERSSNFLEMLYFRKKKEGDYQTDLTKLIENYYFRMKKMVDNANAKMGTMEMQLAFLRAYSKHCDEEINKLMNKELDLIESRLKALKIPSSTELDSIKKKLLNNEVTINKVLEHFILKQEHLKYIYS